MTFNIHIFYTIASGALIEGGTSQLPSTINSLSVTVVSGASVRATARLLGDLAQETQGATL